MNKYYRLWWTLITILIITFGILGYLGQDFYRKAPPIPETVRVENGTTLMTKDSILDGQSAWQSIGGMQLGSIWGHGAYQAPDWSADWLHRELMVWLELAAQDEYSLAYDQLDNEQKQILQFRLKEAYRTNTYDKATATLTLTDRRAQAIQQVADYYDRLFGGSPELSNTSASYAMKEITLPDAERRARLTEFFFWTAWATATERTPDGSTYTNNWPHEPLIDNKPTTENIVWSIISLVLLVAGIGGLVWVWAFMRNKEENELALPADDPLSTFQLTPSQLALGKYLLVVVGLFTFQVFLGGFTAHYTVEGHGFYGIDTKNGFPTA
jgi:nitric oxide reductase subunit B